MTGSGELSGILRALEAAVDPLGAHPADIVNMSLGGDGDGRDLLSVAADNATRSGTLVVAAAGNSGPGEATVGSPAAAPLVLAVGASITNHRVPAATLVTPARRPITATRARFSATAPATDVTAQVIDVGTGAESDFAEAGSVKGKIVAYRGAAPSEGGLSQSIAQRAEQHGADCRIRVHRQRAQPGRRRLCPGTPGADAGHRRCLGDGPEDPGQR